MARHAVVDLCLVFEAPPRPPAAERLTPQELARLREVLDESRLPLQRSDEADARLLELRRTYEPYVASLSNRFLMPLPPFIPASATRDNWQKTAWD
jgi:hypothetical protein